MIQGKIIKGIAGFYYVDVVGSGVYECKAKGIFRKDNQKPLVGDNVEIEVLDEKEKKGNMEKILPRKNALIRPAAANIDQALVVFAVTKPKPHFHLLDRFLVMMEQLEIPVVLCFNKKDLANAEEMEEIREIYQACGYPLIFTSARREENVSEVLEALQGKTTVIAGPSGVGKSSLINLLSPEADMETGGISRKIDRGKHTTRHSELFCVARHTTERSGESFLAAESSFIMDTPGFSSFYINDMEKEELKYCFREFLPYEGKCRFQVCSHIHEPDCAVKQAVAGGKIHKIRYENYVDFYQEIQEKKRY